MYVQSDALLLADVFENFRNMYLEIYDLDPAKCFPAPGLAWQAVLKKAKVKLNFLTEIDMLLMEEKNIRGGICTLYINMQKLITNTWKTMTKINNRHIFNIGI